MAIGAEEAIVQVIALIEDEHKILDCWGDALERAGYKVRKFGTAIEALDELARDPPDLAVIDVQLAGSVPADGFDLLSRLRIEWNVPVKVIIASAVRTEIIDQRLAIKMADRFMRKAIGDEPLLVDMVGQLLNEAQPAPTQIRSHGRLAMDANGPTCSWAGKKVNLSSGAEWKITWALLGQPGVVKSAQELAIAASVNEGGIRQFINDIRKKFERVDSGFGAIKTVRLQGYKYQDDGPGRAATLEELED